MIPLPDPLTELPPLPAEPNCPFYGRYLGLPGSRFILSPFILLDTKGNQCALVTTSTAPCYLEVKHRPIEWRDCDRVAEIRVALGSRWSV